MSSEIPGRPPSPSRILRVSGSPPRPTWAEKAPLTDLYHQVLSLPLSGVIALMAAAFVAINLVFGALYMLAPGGVGNLKPGDFWNAFFFSVQTFGTIGYGYMFPRSFAADLIVTVETFVGLVYVAVATGLVFARVSRPTSRVSFSRFAVVHDFDGSPTLMFRAANRRANQILEAEVMVALARDVTTVEGHTIRRFEEMRIRRWRTPLFAYSWTVMHPIDEASPIRGQTPESLVEQRAELVVVLSGVDDRFAQRVHARHSYGAADIVWNKRFADVLFVQPDGQRVIDYRRFHDLVDL
jgi:inward rectifier potassium channel